jgi:acetyl-CoA carboxylase biotin carboxylase subunit
MSKRILIVNRGEIAIRVAKACREIGFTSIGLWTESEPEAMHLSYCDEWVFLKGSGHGETYLNIDQILDICDQYKVDGVHPGYGFLAENAGFVEKLGEKGITFVGPHAKAIHQMGDKAESKAIALAAGVPVVPGSEGEIHSADEAIEIAEKIGYPVLLKAVAGGGGKGMRKCWKADELASAFETVKRESKSAFGYDGVLIEKFIENPHHIEVQVLCDKKGNAFHLYERECSVQRRHQKIIEEAPSPFIDTNQALREEICQTAVKLAKHVAYDSAGTVEFIMGQDQSFYFLEMNTRVQVEHPITEEITGVDIVVNMLKAAFEMDLDIQHQDQIKIQGHAIELRICSEDPVSMLPAPGKITAFDFKDLTGIRFDHCLYAGYEVRPDFDPMVGKLVAKAFNRDACINKLKAFLKDLFIQGIKNNIDLHDKLLDHPTFKSGDYTTNFLEEVHRDGFLNFDDYSNSEKTNRTVESIIFNTLKQRDTL